MWMSGQVRTVIGTVAGNFSVSLTLVDLQGYDQFKYRVPLCYDWTSQRQAWEDFIEVTKKGCVCVSDILRCWMSSLTSFFEEFYDPQTVLQTEMGLVLCFWKLSVKYCFSPTFLATWGNWHKIYNLKCSFDVLQIWQTGWATLALFLNVCLKTERVEKETRSTRVSCSLLLNKFTGPVSVWAQDVQISQV